MTDPQTLSVFLLAPAPGQVVRLLERRFRTGGIAPGAYRLSSPLLPHGWRVLLAAVAADPAPLVAALSGGFPSHPVTALWRTLEPPPTWNALVFENGTETERITEPLTNTPRGLLARLPGARRPAPSDVIWAESRNLPARFVTGGLSRVSVVDYVTVAQLDQRGLLVETGAPRLYRFSLGPVAETI